MLFIFLTTVLCVLFSINLQFQKQSRPQSKTITEARVLCYIPHNVLDGQQFVFWNNNEPEHTLLSVLWSEYILQHVCVPVYVIAEISIQACDVAYFLPVQSHCKFCSKWLLSCTFSNGEVTPYLFVSSHRGTWRVFKKVSSLVFYIFNSSNEWTFCSSRKFLQVDHGFLYFQNTILLFMFFHFLKKSYIQYM